MYPAFAPARFILALGVIAFCLGGATPARADNYAYAAGGDDDFGVMDLTTGVFTPCGTSSGLLSGLGVGTDHNLYGGGFRASGFYAVNPTNGALTLIGTSNVTFWITGSTTKAVYAVGTDANLYDINIATGQGTLIGPTGVPVNGGWYGISTNSATLYYTVNSNVYKLNLKSGHAKLIGETGGTVFGALVYERGLLYAGAMTPEAIYTLDPKTGAATFSVDTSGLNALTWGLAPIKATAIDEKKLCAAHPI
jgi:hypothetical protein